VVLLLLFELETAVISDDRLNRGSTKWVMLAVRSVCYFFIIYSFYGYWSKFQLVSQFVPFVVQDACSLVGTTFTQVVDLDEYMPLTLQSCAALNGQALVQIVGTEIIATRPAIDAAINLAIVDVINAGDWLLVVAVLEVEVFLQIRGVLNHTLMRLAKILKAVLYSILLCCAVYWGLKGDFLDFWDAFLWLVAFVFIELNVFEWQVELEAQQRDMKQMNSVNSVSP
jgi:hypothetical protein